MKSTFLYQKYSIEKDSIHFSYTFVGETNYDFTHSIFFQNSTLEKEDKNLQRLAFFLGMSIIPFYYSLHFADEILVRAGYTENTSLIFFAKAFQNGLAELRYINKLSVTQPVLIRYESFEELAKSTYSNLAEKYLISNGGGKDSLVSGELLHAAGVDASWFVLGYNSKRAEHILPSIVNSPYSEVIQANQIPDPYQFAKEFKMKTGEGYLGHTPFNLFLSFLGCLTAYVNNHKYFVTSNESAANVGNVISDGFEVNHQYSKSLEYEKDFRDFLKQHLDVGVEYFSAIRPFSAEQIGRYFTQFDKYFPTFISCNTGIVSGKWCNNCSKCAYVFLLIYASKGLDTAMQIFGTNLLLDPAREKDYQDLLGLGGHKPFECVGETEEVRKLFMKVKQSDVLPSLWNNFSFFLNEQTKTYLASLKLPDTTYQQHFIPEDLWNTFKKIAI